jgi:hypothetical protein
MTPWVAMLGRGQWTRGLSVVEAKNSVIWTKPDDLPVPQIGANNLPVGGLFKDRWHALFCDGSVRAFSLDMPVTALRQMIDPMNVVPFDMQLYEKR